MRINTVRQGSAPPIVCVHGMGTNATSWKPALATEALNGSGTPTDPADRSEL